MNDASHRKVIQYVAFADGGAGENEDHGTHVSGSVAGKTPQGGALGAYDGMAPEVSFANFSFPFFLHLRPCVYSIFISHLI